MLTAILWFRDDLRLADNPALQAALKNDYAIIPIYIHAPDEEGNWAPGRASNAWRHRSLQSLDAELRKRGSHLRMFFGPTLQTLQTLIASTGADAVFWNRRYEPAIERRDTMIKQALRREGLRAESYNAALLFEPWELQTKQGDPYKVFTPFWKTALSQWREPKLHEAPGSLTAIRQGPEGVPLETLGLAPELGWDVGFWQRFTPGETGAHETLKTFVHGALNEYRHGRDIPARQGTSRLSPHLHFGELSPSRIATELQHVRHADNAAEIDGYIRELGWREFSCHLLHHFPNTPDENLNPRFEDFKWAQPTRRKLEAWRRGMTGVPIVDAGMRELWHTGWMHNRERMIVASFLSKNLRMHWSHGARWFWDTLVDADLANNTQGWQWTAGTGADAAPYFRVFNPVLQAQRFDPQGVYVRRWIPELTTLPGGAIFAPWEHGDVLKKHAPVYPSGPIVDLRASRNAALLAYKATK